MTWKQYNTFANETTIKATIAQPTLRCLEYNSYLFHFTILKEQSFVLESCKIADNGLLRLIYLMGTP